MATEKPPDAQTTMLVLKKICVDPFTNWLTQKGGAIRIEGVSEMKINK